jgi:hypothetical protein
MEFHVQFHIANYKGKTGRVCVFVTDEAGEQVRNSGAAQYTSPNGHLTVQKTFTPRYDGASYDDFALFIPYGQFYRGSHHYLAKIEIQDGDGKSWAKAKTGGFRLRRST